VSVSRVKLQSQQTAHNGMWRGVKRFDNYTIQAKKRHSTLRMRTDAEALLL